MKRVLLGLLGLGALVVILKWGRLPKSPIEIMSEQITNIIMDGLWESTSL